MHFPLEGPDLYCFYKKCSFAPPWTEDGTNMSQKKERTTPNLQVGTNLMLGKSLQSEPISSGIRRILSLMSGVKALQMWSCSSSSCAESVTAGSFHSGASPLRPHY